MTRQFVMFASDLFADEIFAPGLFDEIIVPVTPSPASSGGGSGGGGVGYGRRGSSHRASYSGAPETMLQRMQREARVSRQNSIIIFACITLASGEPEWEH